MTRWRVLARWCNSKAWKERLASSVCCAGEQLPVCSCPLAAARPTAGSRPWREVFLHLMYVPTLYRLPHTTMRCGYQSWLAFAADVVGGEQGARWDGIGWTCFSEHPCLPCSACVGSGPEAKLLQHDKSLFGRSISLACVPIHPVARVTVLQVSASVARQSRKVRARGKEGEKSTKGRLVLRDTWWTEAVCDSISLLHRSSAIYSLETVLELLTIFVG
jgi:hypothetical protein